MKSIRVGNDIVVRWRIYRYGKEYDVEQNKESISVILANMGEKKVITDYSVVDVNIIVFKFRAEDQGLGIYRLLLVDKSRNSTRIIEECNAFRIVSTANAADDEGTLESTVTITLTSELTAPADGLSAYEVALQNGFVGTEEEWLQSLLPDMTDIEQAEAQRQAKELERIASEEARESAESERQRASAASVASANDAAASANAAASAANEAAVNANNKASLADEATNWAQMQGDAALDASLSAETQALAAKKAADNANAAAVNANTKAEEANNAAISANAAKETANAAAGSANDAAANAEQKATLATEAASSASTAAEAADTAAGRANEAADKFSSAVVQQQGTATDKVMSQKTVTDALTASDQKLSELESKCGILDTIDDEPTAGSDNLVKSSGINKTQFYNFFTGKGNVYTSTTLNCLIPGVTYRVYLRNTVWDIPSGAAGYKFVVSSLKSSQVVDLVGTQMGANCKPYYDFTVPIDSEYIRVGGRATSGVKVWFYIVETSSSYKFDEIRQSAMYNTLPVEDAHMDLAVGSISSAHDFSIKDCLCDINFYSVSPNSTVFIKCADDIEVRIIEYDGSKAYIRWTGYAFRTSFVVGSTTKYIRISARYAARGYSSSNPITVNAFQDGDFGLYYKTLRIDESIADSILNNRDNRRLSIRYVEYGYGYTYLTDGQVKYAADIHSLGWNISDDYIPVNSGDSVKWNFGKYSNTSQCLLIYNADKSVIKYYTANTEIGTRTIIMPADAKYIRISFYEIFNDKPNTIPVEVNGVPYFIDNLSALNAHDTEAFPKTSDNGVIGNYYPEEIIEVNKYLTRGKNSGYHRFQFLHISDNHNNSFGYAEDYLDYSPAKFLINTGDLVNDKFTDGAANTIAKAIAPNKPVYLVLGNHDYSHAPSNQAVFDLFYGNSEIEGTVNHHNTQVSGVAVDKTYYSIDFATEMVKCIMLDMNDGWSDSELPNIGPSGNGTTSGKMSQTQINWFVSELQSAKTNNYHVCVFIHTLPYNVDADRRISGFCDVLDNYELGVNSSLTFLPSIVDGFINGGNVAFDYNGNSYSFTFTAGGHFVSWFCGHTHYDMAGWMQGHTDQFMINVCRPFSDTSKYLGTYDDDKLGSHFNLVTIDTNIKSLSVYRIGQQKTIFATDRKSFRVIYK